VPTLTLGEARSADTLTDHTGRLAGPVPLGGRAAATRQAEGKRSGIWLFRRVGQVSDAGGSYKYGWPCRIIFTISMGPHLVFLLTAGALLLFAGHETTANLLANAVVCLVLQLRLF